MNRGAPARAPLVRGTRALPHSLPRRWTSSSSTTSTSTSWGTSSAASSTASGSRSSSRSCPASCPSPGASCSRCCASFPGRALAPVRWLTIAYIDAFRGIPLLLVLFLVSGFLSAAQADGSIPREIGLPEWFGQPTTFWYGVISLTITYGAYMAEVYRAGIEAVPSGQMEAARSLGMSHGQSMRQIIVPQADPQGDPAAPQRLHRPDEGHLARRGARRRRGRQGRPGRADRVLQRVGAGARRADVPRRDDPARAGRRRPDRAPAGANLAERRWRAARPSPHPAARPASARREARSDGRRRDAQAGRRHEELRRPPRPARRRPRGRQGRGRLRARAERLGQEHAAALHQPARAPREGRRSSSRAATSARARTRPPARRAGSSTTSASASAWSSSSSTSSPTSRRSENVTVAQQTVLGPQQGRGEREGDRAAGARRPRRQAERVPRPPLGRPAAARRDRPRPRDGPPA